MQVTEAQATNRLARLKRLIAIYESGAVSDFMDNVLDKVFAQEAADEEALIERLRANLSQFEAKYGMSSTEFYAEFRNGELGDAMDFMEWASVYEMHEGAVERLSWLTADEL